MGKQANQWRIKKLRRIKKVRRKVRKSNGNRVKERKSNGNRVKVRKSNGNRVKVRKSNRNQVKVRKMKRNEQQVKKKQKKKHLKFIINCSQPVDDDIFDMASFEKFLRDSMKVNNKKGQLGDDVTIIRDHSKITVTSRIHFSKRYLKYLTKKFLKKQSLRDYIRVIARTKDSYYLRYFNINQEGEDDED